MSPGPAADLRIDDAPEAGRYEARIDGVLAGFLEYRRVRARLVLVHTESLPEFEGRGVGGRLVRHAMDLARRDDLRVTPACPFAAAWIERHSEFADLVSWGRRSASGELDGAPTRGPAGAPEAS